MNTEAEIEALVRKEKFAMKLQFRKDRMKSNAEARLQQKIDKIMAARDKRKKAAKEETRLRAEKRKVKQG